MDLSRYLHFVFLSLFVALPLWGQVESPPSPSTTTNWASTISYDLTGVTLSKSVGFYNSLGKPMQSQKWDVLTGNIWTSSTLYDSYGRAAFNTLSAPTGNNFGYTPSFVRRLSDGNTYVTSNFESDENNPSPVSNNQANTLGWYYSSNNSSNPYQDVTNYPFSRTVYSTLNPGGVKKVLGGNKVNGQWLQTYSFSMPAGQELSTSAAFGNQATQYDNVKVSKTVSRDVHGTETVVFTDSDGNTLAAARSGKPYTNTINKIDIQDQGWIDIHIPTSCSENITLSETSLGGTSEPINYDDCFIGVLGFKNTFEAQICLNDRILHYNANNPNSTLNNSQKRSAIFSTMPNVEVSYNSSLPIGTYYRIYDLITEEVVMEVAPGTHNLPSGMYRVELRKGIVHSLNVFGAITAHFSYALTDAPQLFNQSNTEYSVSHCQNYYDYAVNYYDKSGRLTKSVQPNGNASANTFTSTFNYNSLGQLLSTTSPDEGEAKFIYRKDGQIRFSQNSKQNDNQEFSYTNYDRLGRPIESGVYSGDNIMFYLQPVSANDPIDTTPVTTSLTPLGVTNITSNTITNAYQKNSVPLWNSGLYSQQTILENGVISFRSGTGELSMLQDYEVIVGFAAVNDAPGTEVTDIKFGFNLMQTEAGDTAIRIFEHGDYLRNNTNQIINFGTFTENDTFTVNRTEGVITYKKNNTLLHTSESPYLEPLKVDTAFKYINNAINSLVITTSAATTPTNTSINIHSLVDESDGLDDAHCYEQHFTMYDMPDTALNTLLGDCGLPQYAYKQTFLSGNVSKTYTKSPETTTTWYSYDVYGRVKWLVQKVNGLACLKTIDYTYDPVSGQVVLVDYQRHNAKERFIHKYDYNIAGQLTDVYTSFGEVNIADGQFIFDKQAHYKYSETGELIRTELANNLQGIDYIYNLNGQLKAINHPSLSVTNDPGHDSAGTNGFKPDVFGMAIQYHNADYKRTGLPTPITSINASTPNQYNGNIQALRWRTQGTPHSTYAYNYNKNNWLQEAHFDSPGVSEATDYNVNNITYDANGNIKTLTRNGFTDNDGDNAMDNFTYTYALGTNQLQHINDSNDNSDPTRFNDLKSQAINNYVYNNIGQLVLNKQDRMRYEYNAAGLVTKIYELSDTASDSYMNLQHQDYDQEDASAAVFNFNTIFSSSPTSLRHLAIANQDDHEDTFDNGGLSGGGLDNVKLPPYCLDFDTENNPYSNRIQINFYTRDNAAGNIYTVNSVPLQVIEGAYHNLKLDVLLLQEQLLYNFNNGDYTHPMTANATVSVLEGDTVLATHNINAQSITPSYCNRVADHVSLSFVPNSSTISIRVAITNTGIVPNDAPLGNDRRSYRNIYQSVEFDNFVLEVADTPRLAFYYNDRGHRVRKEKYDDQDNTYTTFYVRDAAGSPMAIYNHNTGPSIGTSNPELKEYPIYGASRLGICYNNPAASGSLNIDRSGSFMYQLTDHLGNVRAVIMKDGNNALSLTGKTDYYPGGMAMPGRNIVGDYRYDYQGQEKDRETGKNAFTLRLYDARINRWITPDPYGEFFSPYLAMGNNWLNRIDPTGGMTDCPDCPDPPIGTILLDEVVVTATKPSTLVKGAAPVAVGLEHAAWVRRNFYVPNDSFLFEGFKRGELSQAEYALARYDLQGEARSRMTRSGQAASELAKTRRAQMQTAHDFATGKKEIRVEGKGNTNTRNFGVKGTLLRGATRATIVYGVYSTVEHIHSAEDKGLAISQEAGGWAGAWGGAKAGAAIGSFFGPVGTIVGGIIGGAVGYAAGYSAGGAIYREFD